MLIIIAPFLASKHFSNKTNTLKAPMDLTSAHPYWLLNNGLLHNYPHLDRHLEADVTVIGGGITGSLIAHKLTEIGKKVIVIDRRDIALGSTAACTALLQYEIDVSLVDMAEKIGLESANRAYRLSHWSIDELARICSTLNPSVGFEKKTSIYLADSEDAAEHLHREFIARDAIGLDVDLLDNTQIQNRFPLKGTAALVTNQAATCDPHRLCHELLQAAMSQGCQVYDRTEMLKLETRNDKLVIRTNRGYDITTTDIVMATGYEASDMLKEKVVDLDSTYALVSEPLDQSCPWKKDWILWQAQTPYLYLRLTPDGRLMAGGEDDEFQNATLRDASLPSKTKTIQRKLHDLLPGMVWEPEFSWAGTFGKTQDGLAYIGIPEEHPHIYFALGFGGNGVTFSCIARDVIAAEFQGNPHPDANLFRFGR